MHACMHVCVCGWVCAMYLVVHRVQAQSAIGQVARRHRVQVGDA
jgi:hypothetical protein